MEWVVEYWPEDKLQEFVDSLTPKGQHKVQWCEQRLREFGLDIRKTDWAEHIEDNLWVLRIQLGRIEHIRLFYYRSGRREFTIVHGFKKKTNKTPRRETEMALKRMKNHKAERARPGA